MCYNFTRMLLVLALLLPEIVSGSGLRCKEEEQRALLHIKAEMSFSFLKWEGKECCNWERVACHSTTGHVTELDFGDFPNDYTSNIDHAMLNATLFLPLRQLSSLSLSGLDIYGYMPGAGFESWSGLSNLKMLNLSHNYLNTSTISSLVEIQSLRILDLHDNPYIQGDVLVKEFTALKLEVVNLCSCGFSGSLPYLGDWSSLKALSLANNYLNGTLTSKGLCRLENLEELDLSNNDFDGNIPPCIGNLSSLKLVDFSDNRFELKFPTSMFERVVSLRYLSLSNNHLEGTLSISSFSNHSYLEVLGLSTSALNFQVEVFSLSFQLQDLELSNCNLSVEPTFLYSQQKLRALDLSNTGSKGLSPVLWLLENNTNLVLLDLHTNLFTGPLRLPLLTHEISVLDTSDNNLSGELPVDVSTKLPNLYYLNLSNNHFDGPLPFISMAHQQYLDLSLNNLTDNIQNAFSVNLAYQLNFVDLSYNNFFGSFTNITDHLQLSTLLLNHNKISGELPLGICNISFIVLDISNNALSGVLPDCIGRTAGILGLEFGYMALSLSANHLEGSIPLDICQIMWLLDLSDNKLSGSIPPCSNNSYFQVMDLSKNNLSGNYPMSWLNVSDIIAIDIGQNMLSGELQIWNSTESRLNAFLARDNMFGGHIPEQICQFKYLHILDLALNNFSGQIPSCIIGMGLKYDSDLFMPFGMSTEVGELNFGDANFILYINKHIILNKYKIEANGLQNYGMELMSKGRFDLHWYKILFLECTIDLSSNKLVGNIPEEIDQITLLTTLNLSNNHLTGAIPDSISKLQHLLSLDLSHNSLTGQIPRELTKLTSLEVFSVAYNNLSGPTLDMKAQFATFDNRSYEGNPNLCGPPLSKSCFSYHDTKLPSQNKTENDQADESIDFLILFSSFSLFFVVSFWGLITVLYFKSNWRYGLFNLVDEYGDVIYLRVVLFVRKIRAAQRDN
ncbi:Receptor like protein 14 [Rhynchospora pubera]|uniref:Receptor like protein 14 n=1 Tax=Rhynchospora pubera TaxID=906938 RepID=A0AAV8HAI7_9POAL|nr:Receptor like protein 14 [Rhynchospora pubera]